MKELHPEYDYMDTPDRDEFMNDQDDSTLDGIEAQTNLVTPAPAQAEDVAKAIAQSILGMRTTAEAMGYTELEIVYADIVTKAFAPLVQRAEMADELAKALQINYYQDSGQYAKKPCGHEYVCNCADKLCPDLLARYESTKDQPNTVL